MKALKILNIGNHLSAIRYELFSNRDLFDQFTARQEYPGTAHGDTKTIVLRIGKSITPDTTLDQLTEYSIYHETEFHDWDNREKFPCLNRCVDEIFKTLGLTELGWLTIVSLRGSGYVARHIDEGEYCRRFDRFHMPILADDADFYVEDERFRMEEGELWVFQNKRLHHAVNRSQHERIHVVFDAR